MSGKNSSSTFIMAPIFAKVRWDGVDEVTFPSLAMRQVKGGATIVIGVILVE
jgi:hypothetical protein